jgi:hypothetical protein
MRPITLSTSDASAGTKNSAPAVLDYYGRPEVSLQVVVTGTATWTVQQTLDNVLDATATITYFNHPDTANMVTQTVNRQGNYAYIPTAVRLQQTAGTGSAILTIVQAGLRN